MDRLKEFIERQKQIAEALQEKRMKEYHTREVWLCEGEIQAYQMILKFIEDMNNETEFK